MTIVLDSSAVLEMLFRQPGSATVKKAFDDEPDRVLVSAVNLTEIVGKLVDRGMTDDEIAQTIASLPMRVIDFDSAAGLIAGSLHRDTKVYGLSLGDRVCLALAMRTKARVLTADRIWARIDPSIIDGVRIDLVR